MNGLCDVLGVYACPSFFSEWIKLVLPQKRHFKLIVLFWLCYIQLNDPFFFHFEFLIVIYLHLFSLFSVRIFVWPLNKEKQSKPNQTKEKKKKKKKVDVGSSPNGSWIWIEWDSEKLKMTLDHEIVNFIGNL